MPAVAAKPKRSKSLTIFKTRYERTLAGSANHVRYIAFRSRELPNEPYGIFSRDSDRASVNQFIGRLRVDEARTRSPRVPRMHRMIFSLRRYHFDRAGIDWRPFVREVMGRVEQQMGARLDWVAAIHGSQRHPHVHVAVRSMYTDLAGRQHRLYINPELRERFKSEADRIVRRELERRRELEQIRPKPRVLRPVQEVLRTLAEWRRREQEAERERLLARIRRVRAEREREEWER